MTGRPYRPRNSRQEMKDLAAYVGLAVCSIVAFWFILLMGGGR